MLYLDSITLRIIAVFILHAKSSAVVPIVTASLPAQIPQPHLESLQVPDFPSVEYGSPVASSFCKNDPVFQHES